MSGLKQKEFDDAVQKLSKEKGLKKPQIQLLIAQERFLARLATLPEGKNFIWKGGSLVLRRYSKLPTPRYTIDIDIMVQQLLIKNVNSVFEKAISLDLEDGFSFSGMKIGEFERDTPYGGLRIDISWKFFGKGDSQFLRIDACAGDVVDVETTSTEELFLFPNHDDLSLKIYPPEFIFAEKLHAVVYYGTGNTRLKDYIDMWTLQQGQLDLSQLENAIQKCFANRKTPLDPVEIRRILEDESYIHDLEQRRKRSADFRDLKTPEMKVIFSSILSVLETLRLI